MQSYSGDSVLNTMRTDEGIERDVGVLSVLAYNQILVQRFEDAFALYELLRQIKPSEVKWLGGSAYCCLRLGRWREADDLLCTLDEQKLTSQESQILSRLRLEITFFAESENTITQTQGEA